MDEMAAAIAAFLQTAASLYRHASASHAGAEAGDQVDDTVVVRDAARWTAQFEALLAGLDGARADASDPDAAVKPLHGLAKACWKIAQDILLRLRGIAVKSPLPDIDTSYWPSRDVEVLGVRLVELETQWHAIQQSTVVDTAALSESLSKLNLANKFKTESPNAAPAGESKEAQGKAFRPPSAGILSDFILESLSFKSMKNREEEVADAHGNSFDWLFQPAPQGSVQRHFVKWLSGHDLGSIYWVTGKPGSGKSTLMRYIAEHATTGALLQSWAGDQDLVRASFYFWTSGSEEQRSLTGLLRYLLHQMLSHDLSLMPQVFPQLWQTLSRLTTKERIQFQTEWAVPELLAGFERFLEHALPTRKLCLFVDGLDEFDGDHNTILQFFRGLVEGERRERIKLCLSSRPWAVFEAAFARAVPNLKLQDLTYQDMHQYVHDYLKGGRHLARHLQQNRAVFDLLTQQILKQAEGVFLWARLVVRKVLEAFDRRDATVGDMQAFVATLPSELDDLFAKLLLDGQTPAALALSSQLFQLVRAREVVADFIKDEASNSLTIWELAFALRANDDELAINGEVEEVRDDAILDRCIKAQYDISSQSTGLLEIYSRRERGNHFRKAQASSSPGQTARKLAANRITYLHRTVRDYLMHAPGVWSRLLEHSPSSFDPHLRLLRSYVLRLKHSLEEIEHHRRLDEWYPDIALSLTHARHIQNDAQGFQTPLLNELDKTISWYWLTRKDDPFDHWARSCFGSYEDRRGNTLIWPLPFVLLCTRFGLERYVLDTLDDMARSGAAPIPALEEDQDLKDKLWCKVEATPLLRYALEFLVSRQKTLFPLSSPSFILALLTSPHRHHTVLGPFIGAPNVKYDAPLAKQSDLTPWTMLLRHLRDAKRRGWIEPLDADPDGSERWVQIIKMMIQPGGADLDVVIKADGWDPEASAKDILVGSKQLGGVQDWWIHGLQEYF